MSKNPTRAMSGGTCKQSVVAQIVAPRRGSSSSRECAIERPHQTLEWGSLWAQPRPSPSDSTRNEPELEDDRTKDVRIEAWNKDAEDLHHPHKTGGLPTNTKT